MLPSRQVVVWCRIKILNNVSIRVIICCKLLLDARLFHLKHTVAWVERLYIQGKSPTFPDDELASSTYGPNLPEVRYMWALLSQGGALRAYPELLTDESLRLSFFFDDVVLITAWRTTCLYGVSHRQSLAEALCCFTISICVLIL